MTRLGYIWGRFGQLYGGPPIGTLERRARRRQGAPARHPPACSGFRYDLVGGARAGADRRRVPAGETLHYFAYDWRQPVVGLGRDAGGRGAAPGGRRRRRDRHPGAVERRADRARRLRGRSRRCRSSGWSPRAARTPGRSRPSPASTPGFSFAPLGRRVVARGVHVLPGRARFDPRAGGRRFLPEDAGYDLYDVETWRRLRLSVFRRHPDDPVWTDVVRQAAGGRARALPCARRGGGADAGWSASAGPACRRRSGSSSRRGARGCPGEGRLAGLPPAALGDGDGTIAIEAAHAWAGAEPEVVKMPVTRHRDMVRTQPCLRRDPEARCARSTRLCRVSALAGSPRQGFY